MQQKIKLTTITLGLLFMAAPLNAQLSPYTQDENEIKGVWRANDEGNRHQIEELEIYLNEENGKYFGEDPSGRILLKDLVYDESDKEYSGKLVSSGGRELSATVVFVDKDTIKVTGRRFLHRWSFTMSRDKEEK